MRLAIPPRAHRWAIRDVRVPAAALAGVAPGAVSAEGLATVDIVLEGDRIAALGPGAGAGTGDIPVLPGAGALLLPCFVDAHTHLDKGHIAPRAPNPDGTRDGALATVAADRTARWSPTDAAARTEVSLRCAYAHGTAAIRTHIDSVGPQTRLSWPVFGAVRDRWRGRIDLQASPLLPIDHVLDDAAFAEIVAMVEAYGGVLGAVTFPCAALRPGLDRLFRVAADRGWDLDFHADETGDPAVNTLAAIAETAIRTGFPGRILAGHCCSLAVMPEAERARTIDRVARARVAVVSLPMCNMYLQDRAAGARAGSTTPRWRGVTALKELAHAGVPVMIASDNTRDPFYAYGDLDMAEVWREGTRILHLDHPFGDWARMVGRVPAEILGRPRAGVLEAGGLADFVLFGVRSLSEWMSRPAARTVVRGGRPIAAAPPSYAELDHLDGLRP